jgi:hypothetical protein
MRGYATLLNRVAIGLRARNAAGASAAIRSADIFDDNGLSKRAPYLLGKNPRDTIGEAACRDRHDHRDGMRRIGLGVRDLRYGRKRGNAAARCRNLRRASSAAFALTRSVAGLMCRRCVGWIFDPVGRGSTPPLRCLLMLMCPSSND